MDASNRDALRSLPAVGSVIERIRAIAPDGIDADATLVTHLTRRVLDRIRNELRNGLRRSGSPIPLDEIVAAVRREIEQWRRTPRTQRVVNATGIILHSGLGRAPMPRAAIEALSRAGDYVLLEVDQERGERRRRDLFIEELLCDLLGAEAAFVVNNNAAATMLILNTVGAGREIIVSRSQMVEIGGLFRMPDVMEMAGCRLREVGTTNRSYVSDYEQAIGPETGALALIHTSNYRIVGFTGHVSLEEMVALGKKRSLPVIHDIGSGSLFPSSRSFSDDPMVRNSLRTGADLVCFSGDKMIGGPQAGIIVGKKELVDRTRKNPLARALRIDKLACIALEETLKLYFEPDRLLEEIPALRMLEASPGDLERRALALAQAIRDCDDVFVDTTTIGETSEMGAGALPTVALPTTCVAIRQSRFTPNDLAYRLRLSRVPIFTRIKEDRVLLDPRTLVKGDEERIVDALRSIVHEQKG